MMANRTGAMESDMSELGCFIIEQVAPGHDRGIGYYPTLEAAKKAHGKMEPRPSRPELNYPYCWRFMIVAEFSSTDCRPELVEQSKRFFAQAMKQPGQMEMQL